MAKDPICGMTVSEVTALCAERDGQTHYFCSEHCRQKFIGQAQVAKTIPLTQAEPTSGCCGGAKADAASGSRDCCGGQPGHGAHGQANHAHGGASVKPSGGAKYFCPMCPGVESDEPGDCPKCGMALERNPAWVAPAAGKVIYTCPMHPEVQQDHPGHCHKCGMALEPVKVADAPDEENHELVNMTRRFWIGTALTLPVFLVAMAHLVPSLSHAEWVSGEVSRWGQFILSTPVVLWAGWPFFVRGWRSLVNRSLNMFTLIALGVGAAYVFSVVAMFFPQSFPPTAGHAGMPAIYFEAAAVITVLVLLGQVLELRARQRTS